MQLTISTVASLLLIGGAIALPEPRSRYARAKEPEVAVNNLGPTDRPGAEDIYNCYILGTNRYPYLKEEINCLCNCGGTECVGPNVGEINIDLKYDRILPDACTNAFQKLRYGTSSEGEKLTMAEVFDGQDEEQEENYAVSGRENYHSANMHDYDGWTKYYEKHLGEE